jgi:hypothetical protein
MDVILVHEVSWIEPRMSIYRSPYPPGVEQNTHIY